jgi:hypothetical protein
LLSYLILIFYVEHKAQSTKHKAQSTKHKAQSTKHNAQCTKHKAQCTMHSLSLSLQFSASASQNCNLESNIRALPSGINKIDEFRFMKAMSMLLLCIGFFIRAVVFEFMMILISCSGV